jgi:mannose-6-phosphate isomerase-like protein (cupin superfamily)
MVRRLSQPVHTVQLQEGEAIFIPPGTIHETHNSNTSSGNCVAR